MYEHNYYQDEGFATLGYDFNAGRAFPQNFSTIFEDDDQVQTDLRANSIRLITPEDKITVLCCLIV